MSTYGKPGYHDPATDGMHFAYYICDTCGERYPMLVEYAFDVLVGGMNCHSFARHGPGCRSQRWIKVSDHVIWPQPASVLDPLKGQIERYLAMHAQKG